MSVFVATAATPTTAATTTSAAAARQNQIHAQLDIVAPAAIQLQHIREKNTLLAQQTVFQEARMVEHLEQQLRLRPHQHRELVVPLGHVRVLDEFGFAIRFVVDKQLHVRIRLEDAIVAQRCMLDDDNQLMVAVRRCGRRCGRMWPIG